MAGTAHAAPGSSGRPSVQTAANPSTVVTKILQEKVSRWNTLKQNFSSRALWRKLNVGGLIWTPKAIPCANGKLRTSVEKHGECLIGKEKDLALAAKSANNW